MTKFASMADNFPAVLQYLRLPQNFNDECIEVQEIHKGFTEASRVAIIYCTLVHTIKTCFKILNY